MKTFIILLLVTLFLNSCDLDNRYFIDTNILATPEILIGDWNKGSKTFMQFSEDGTGKIMYSKNKMKILTTQ